MTVEAISKEDNNGKVVNDGYYLELLDGCYKHTAVEALRKTDEQLGMTTSLHAPFMALRKNQHRAGGGDLD